MCPSLHRCLPLPYRQTAWLHMLYSFQPLRRFPPSSMCTQDAVKIVDEMAFPIDTDDREQMLKILNSCIGTKYAARFGDLIAVRCWPSRDNRYGRGTIHMMNQIN